MNKKTIVFFSCEPGGAEVLSPVVHLVRERTRYEPIVLSYGFGAQRFAGRGIEHIEITGIAKDGRSIFEEYQADLAITSAASLPERDMTEKYIWKQAKERGVPSLAFLDQWQNYVPRFSGPGESERLAYLPDYINCIDGVGEIEMVREGFDPRTLVKLGHPYLSSLQAYAAIVDQAEVRVRMNIPPDARVALFASEAIREHFGRQRGYDQYDALRLFLEITSRSSGDVTPLIKLHPKDSETEYRLTLKSHRGIRPVLVKNELTATECITIADVVYGMTSTMLIEAFVLGKQAISLQPGLQGEDLMALSRLGLIPLVTGASHEPARLEAVPKPGAAEFSWSFDPDTALSFIEELML